MRFLALIGDPTPVITPPVISTGDPIVSGPYSEPAVPPWSEAGMSGPSFAYHYVQGAELPPLKLLWADGANRDIDFSTGWIFTVLIGHLGQPASVSKTSGISGGVGFVTIGWSPDVAADLNLLAPGRYDCSVRARRTSDSADRKRIGEIVIEADIAG